MVRPRALTLVATALMALSVPGLPNTAAAATPVASPPLAANVAADEQAFALDLLHRLGPSAANLVLSPSSLAVLLAMLEPGATGPTEAGIARALHSAPLTAAGQAVGWRALDRELVAASSAKTAKTELEVANEVWLQQGLPVRTSYRRLLGAEFGAGVQEAQIADDPAGAANAIDNWARDHTGGHIRHLLNAAQLQHIVAVLVDAVYFDAAWKSPFDPALTAPHVFHLSAGHAVSVPMMAADRPFDVPVSLSPSLDAVALPYKGGRFQALVLMPPAGTLGQFEQRLTPAVLQRIVAGLRTRQAVVKLPRSALNSDLELKGTLTSMGMALAFSDNADFSNLSPRPLTIGFVVQDAQMEVDERGTEASAASGAGLAPTAVEAPPPVPVVFDHPYLFLVRDSVTGTVLFAAQVGDPDQT